MRRSPIIGQGIILVRRENAGAREGETEGLQARIGRLPVMRRIDARFRAPPRYGSRQMAWYAAGFARELSAPATFYDTGKHQSRYRSARVGGNPAGPFTRFDASVW